MIKIIKIIVFHRLIHVKTNKIISTERGFNMSFPFEFAKKSGPYDFMSPAINFTGNATVVAVGGICLGTISNLALKALGFSNVVTSATTAIPVVIGVTSVVGVAIPGLTTADS